MKMEEENTSNVTCIRAPRDKDHPYFMTARNVAQDLSLSLDERGMLWYILSLPSDWISHPMHLGKMNGIKSKEKIYGMFRKLMKAGYCERINHRLNGKNHSTTYKFYEEKQQRLIDLHKEEEEKEVYFLENRNQDFLVPVLQESAKQDITEYISSTKKKKKKREHCSGIEFDHETQQFINISEADKSEWLKLYPGVDIDRELIRMRQWLIDPKNPERDGHRTFITRWLDKAFEDFKKKSKRASPEIPQQTDYVPRYDSSMAYSILHEDGIEEYVDYLKSLNDQKYYQNYQKGIYETNYIEYAKEKGL